MVELTGPSGKMMLLPEHSPSADLIMIATGTGVAPFRAFFRRLFVEPTIASSRFTGNAWLIHGVTDRSAALFADELQTLQESHSNRVRIMHALSREQLNPLGGKMYVQDRVEEHGEELFERMARGAHIYFCGLKGMMGGVLKSLEEVATKKNLVWSEVVKQWKANGQWHVEVY